MMKRVNKSRLLGVVGILFAAWIFWQTGTVPERLVANEPGPRFFPYISAAGIFVFSVMSMIFDGNKEAAAIAEKGCEPFFKAGEFKRLCIIIFWCIVFAFSMHYIGFCFTGMAGLYGFIRLLGGKKPVNKLFLLVFSIAFGSLCCFGFTRGFVIPLPKGVIWDLLGIPML